MTDGRSLFFSSLLSCYVPIGARVGYSVHGWDLLAGALFEGGVLGQKGTEFRTLLDTVQGKRGWRWSPLWAAGYDPG